MAFTVAEFLRRNQALRRGHALERGRALEARWRHISENSWWWNAGYLVRATLLHDPHCGPPRWRVEVRPLSDEGDVPPVLWTMPVFEERDEAIAVGRAWCEADEVQRAALEHWLPRGSFEEIGRLVGRILGK